MVTCYASDEVTIAYTGKHDDYIRNWWQEFGKARQQIRPPARGDTK